MPVPDTCRRDCRTVVARRIQRLSSHGEFHAGGAPEREGRQVIEL